MVTATRATAENGPDSLKNTQRLDSFVTDGVAGKEKTAVGIIALPAGSTITVTTAGTTWKAEGYAFVQLGEYASGLEPMT